MAKFLVMTVIVSCALFFRTSVTWARQDINLVLNGDFEVLTGNDPAIPADYWECRYEKGDQWKRVSGGVPMNSLAVEITQNGTKQPPLLGNWRQPIPVQPKMNYRMKVWAQGLIKNGRLSVRVEWLNALERVVGAQTLEMALTDEWRELDRVLTVPVDGINARLIMGGVGGKGTYRVDRVGFFLDENEVFNPGFMPVYQETDWPSGWNKPVGDKIKTEWASNFPGQPNYLLVQTKQSEPVTVDNRGFEVAISSGEQYRFNSSLSGEGIAVISLSWLDKTGKVIGSLQSQQIKLQKEQQTVAVQGLAPLETGRARMTIELKGSGTLILNSVALTRQLAEACINIGPGGTVTGLDINSAAASERVVSGHGCRLVTSQEPLKVKITPETAGQMGTSIAVAVEYYDQGVGNFALDYYDGTGQRRIAAKVTKHNTLAWKRYTFYLPRYSPAVNFDSDWDIRLSSDNESLAVKYLTVFPWKDTRIVDNHLEVDGKPKFEKIGVPLGDMAGMSLNKDTLSKMVEKGYTAVRFNAYWQHFAPSDKIFRDPAKLLAVMDEAKAKGLDLGLSFGTYPVGGGGTPQWIYSAYPGVQAVNGDNQPAVDDYYPPPYPKPKIPSLLNPAFLNRSRDWMTSLLRVTPNSRMTWYAPNVEPMWAPGCWIDYSPAGLKAYHYWLGQRWTLPELREKFQYNFESIDAIPLPNPQNIEINGDFEVQWETWLDFRAHALAQWVNGDVQTIRNVAGEQALVAVDFLTHDQGTITKMHGRSELFADLVETNIWKINFHWTYGGPWNAGYNMLMPLARRKNQALAEHMDINGEMFEGQPMDLVLKNTLDKGNRFGWETMNVQNLTGNHFTVYNDDWSPKPEMKELDTHNEQWLKTAGAMLTKPLQTTYDFKMDGNMLEVGGNSDNRCLIELTGNRQEIGFDRSIGSRWLKGEGSLTYRFWLPDDVDNGVFELVATGAPGIKLSFDNTQWIEVPLTNVTKNGQAIFQADLTKYLSSSRQKIVFIQLYSAMPEVQTYLTHLNVTAW